MNGRPRSSCWPNSGTGADPGRPDALSTKGPLLSFSGHGRHLTPLQDHEETDRRREGAGEACPGGRGQARRRRRREAGASEDGEASRTAASPGPVALRRPAARSTSRPCARPSRRRSPRTTRPRTSRRSMPPSTWPSRRTPASAVRRARPTSRTRSPRPRSWPSSASTRSRSRPRSCTTSPRTPNTA